jgi:malonyl-CoA decarboxylase
MTTEALGDGPDLGALRPSRVQGGALQSLLPALCQPGEQPAEQQRLITTVFASVMNGPSFFRRLVRSVVPPAEQRQARRALELCQALMSVGGEVSGALIARDALAAYSALSNEARAAFFDGLGIEFSPDPVQLARAYDDYRNDPTQENLVTLQRCVEAPRQELFRRLNAAPGATAALVAMRRKILDGLRKHPEWTGIDADLAHLFGSWFNRGFLTLERIDWHTPAIVLEKLIEYEAVHEIAGWNDLRRRLAADRRCFAFFHPALPHEPLIFIEVAFTRGMSASVEHLLAPDAPQLDPRLADTAIFYSITNCQPGLRGISFGNLLIKQVAQRLGQEFPRIKTFATLSPIPGFRAWLKNALKQLDGSAAAGPQLEVLNRIENPDWHKNAVDAERVRKALTPFAAYYLALAKHDREAADPVARFHLGNGARLERLNWLADTSKRGMQQSAGMMVNYLYRLEHVEQNHEMYVRAQKVSASRELRKLAADCVLQQNLSAG